MVNLLKNSSTQGLYITIDNAGKIVANTPGDLDLDGLSLGTQYVYFDTLARFEEKGTFNREEPDFIGFKSWQTAATTVNASTGGGSKAVFLITVETDETTGEYVKTLSKLNVKIGGGQLYIVKQTASEAFEQFPNSSSTLKKYVPIIMRGYNIIEKADSGKDVKLINIACEQIDARN